MAEKRAETLANAGFSACGQPLKCRWVAPHLSALCPSSVKDRAPHLSVVAPLKCQYRQGTYPQACPHHLWETRVKSGVFADLRGWPAPRRRPKSSLPLICVNAAPGESAPQVSTSAPHLSVRAKFSARYPQRRRPRCLAHGFDGVSGAFAGP